MGLVLTEEQALLKQTAREFIEANSPVSELRRLRDSQDPHGIDRKLWSQMVELGCDECYLETEITNKGALRLYERLGFMRDVRLIRYYLNGNDAFRLKIFFHDVPIPAAADGGVESGDDDAGADDSHPKHAVDSQAYDVA